jgi:hypothetical protein
MRIHSASRDLFFGHQCELRPDRRLCLLRRAYWGGVQT